MHGFNINRAVGGIQLAYSFAIIPLAIPTWIIWPIVYEFAVRKLGQSLKTTMISAVITALLITVVFVLFKVISVKYGAIDVLLLESFKAFLLIFVMVLIAAIPAAFILWHFFAKKLALNKR